MAKKQNTCNRQFRSTDSDGNKKLNTKKKKNEKKRTKKPCHRRTNQNLPLRRRVVRQPPSKDVLRLLKWSLLEAFLECTKIWDHLREHSSFNCDESRRLKCL